MVQWKKIRQAAGCCRGRGQPDPALHERFVPGIVKMACTEVWGVAALIAQGRCARENVAALSERLAGWQVTERLRRPRNTPRFVIARPRRGRGNLVQAVAISPMNFLLSGHVPRDCHVGRWPPRNDNSGTIPVLSSACTGWQRVTGRRGRRPLQGVCGRRGCAEICNCHRRSLSAATDAIGLYIFIGSLYGLQAPSRDCHGREAPSQ